MASYIMLFNYTAHGLEKVMESPTRVEAAKKLCRDLGGEVKQFFGLMGRYDTMFILEAPDDETAAKIAVAISRRGNVRSETLRAFTETEFRQIMSALPS